jgi:adenylate cyclase
MKLRRVRKAAAAGLIGLFSITTALLLSRIPFLRTVEWKIYDLQIRKAADPSEARRDIALIEIDDQSIERMAENGFGRFPWPRDVYAVLLRYLERNRPKVIAFDLLFLEEDRATEGASRDRELVEATRRLGNVIHSVDVNDTHKFHPALPANAGFRLSEEIEEHQSVKNPFDALANASVFLGHTFIILDPDGPVRRTVPFVRQGSSYYPSLSIATAMLALRLQPADINLKGNWLQFGRMRIPVVRSNVEYLEKIRAPHLLIRYKGPAYRDSRRVERSYPTYRFWDLVLSEAQIEDGKKPLIDPSIFGEKILFIGTTASGLHDLFNTPFGELGKMPGIQIHASVVDSILSGTFLRPAGLAGSVSLLLASCMLTGLFGVYAGFWPSLALACGIVLGDLAIVTASFRSGVWVPLVPSFAGIVLAQFSSVAYKYFVEDKQKRQVKGLFSRFVSPDVVKELMEDPSRARLGGQRREVTVLFADIRGFTTLSEAGNPEDLIGQLNEYFASMVDLLFKHHGTLDKFVGDMIMGIFNAPLQDLAHADHAVQMGLAMLRELKILNERWTREGKPNFDIGIGINTGDVIVGNVGSERTLSYTVIGDHVNLGSRLESLNKELQTHIIISEYTCNRLQGAYMLRPLGKFKVKGKTREVELFEVCASQEELDRRGMNVTGKMQGA